MNNQAPINQVQVNQVEIAKYNLNRQLKGSASWFYWIAGLSMVNWIASNFKIGFVMLFGLGATQFVDGVAQGLKGSLGPDYATLLTVISLVATLGISGVYALFGYFGGKRANWAFVTGIVLYILDAIVFIVAKDYLPLIFHAWAVIALLRGPSIIKKLRMLEEAQTPGGMNTQPF